jgi:hypothetical protein
MGQIADHDRGWQSWLRHDHKQTLRTVERDLQATQVLQVHERKRLGLIATTHVTVADAALVDVLQQEARAILHGSQPVEEVEPVDAAVVALCAAGRVPAVVSRGDRRDYDDRIDALTDRVAAIAPGLRDAFRGIRTTMIAAQGGMGGG